MGPIQAYEAVARYLDGDVAGRCYEASEAIYHMAGGKVSGLVPCVVRMPDGGTHWFLRWGSTVFDVTERQYGPTRVPYERARGCGFLTKAPSRRAAAIILAARLPLQNRRSGKDATVTAPKAPAK